MKDSKYQGLIDLYFNEVLKNGKHDLLDQIIHPAYIPYENMQDKRAMHLDLRNRDLIYIQGIEGIKYRIKVFSEQFNEIEFEPLDIVETKETLVVHYKVAMRHVGEWNEIPPTNLKIHTYGFHLFKFKENKIFSITGMFDMTDILSQLGAAIVNEKSDLQEYLENIKKLLRL